MTPRTIALPSNARSRRTRSALLAAARSILEEQGFDALTMTAVAKRAAVTRAATYLHFPSRSELMAALFDHIADAEGLDESVSKVWDAPDAATTLDRWAAHLANYHPRLLALDRALQHVWRRDPDAAAHRARVVGAQLANCRRIARRLADEGRLTPDWTITSATDMLYALISSDIVERVLVDRHRSTARLARYLALLLRSTFLDG